MVETQLFTKHELGIIYTSLKYKELPVKNQSSLRFFDKTDELTALESFREIKKGIEENGQFKDCELVFGTQQRDLIIKVIESLTRSLEDLEIKVNLIEKLKTV